MLACSLVLACLSWASSYGLSQRPRNRTEQPFDLWQDGRYLVDWHGLEEVFVANWEGGPGVPRKVRVQDFKLADSDANLQDLLWGVRVPRGTSCATMNR